jgi:two-component system phosphate regulon sensor histidine kinase PhoR
MSISLIGIIAVQVYWINNALESKKVQFNKDVFKALVATSERIKASENDMLYQRHKGVIEDIGLASRAKVKNYLIQQYDKTRRQRFSVGTTILEENFKIPTDFLDNDSILVKRITTKKDFFKSISIKKDGDLYGSNSEERYSYSSRNKEEEKREIIAAYKEIRDSIPITERISNRELNETLREELIKRNVTIDYKYGVYNNDGLATPLKSGYYTVNTSGNQGYPLLKNGAGNFYKLYITFPTRNKLILSGISNVLLLSLFFIFIIIIVFSSSLYQLMRQKKISEIKTDFINNMTHEFKTPIATINLALDSIKNPKIINDSDKVLRYVQMIRDENKRMHSQVENVLRISRLQKNQIEMNKEIVDGHDIIEDAITHISLLIQDRNGTINTSFKAITAETSGNQFHLTNVVVNILENALKYSEGAPKIDIYTESNNKFFIFTIKDEGIGMSKSVQKNVFQKFYREERGNIHNVKGHGLGLAYVKEIVEKHHGTVFVESEKGKGSIFTIKLPII